MTPERPDGRLFSTHRTLRGAERMCRGLEELRGKGDTDLVLSEEQYELLCWCGDGPIYVEDRGVFRYEVRCQRVPEQRFRNWRESIGWSP